ncbi:hypothetical protein O988_02650 [Pseudogymnoascus sp. VKM F-3808]|nr:hypothetical protein O988_02650 [Pseudogymnoascus sp. VKM F-3808]
MTPSLEQPEHRTFLIVQQLAHCLSHPSWLSKVSRLGQSCDVVLEATSHIEATRPQLCGHRSPLDIPRIRFKQGKALRGDIALG